VGDRDRRRVRPYLGKDVLGDAEVTGMLAGREHPEAALRRDRPQPRIDLAAHVPYRSPRPHVPVRLDTNESPSPPPDRLRAELAALAGTHDWHRYGDLDATALRARLADLHGRTPAGVWVAAGTFELLAQLFQAVGGAGRTLGVLEPAWGGYRQVAAAAGTTVIDGDPAGADVVVVCSPNNPTGHATPADMVARLCERHPGRLVIVDEAYAEFSSQPSAAGLLALDYLEEVAATVALVVRERQRVYDALARLPGVRVRPSDANFLCFATPEPSGEVRRGLLERGVAIRDVSGLAHLPDHLRVTIGVPADNRAFLAALGEVLS